MTGGAQANTYKYSVCTPTMKKHPWERLPATFDLVLLERVVLNSQDSSFYMWELPMFALIATIGGLLGAGFVAFTKRFALFRARKLAGAKRRFIEASTLVPRRNRASDVPTEPSAGRSVTKHRLCGSLTHFASADSKKKYVYGRSCSNSLFSPSPWAFRGTCQLSEVDCFFEAEDVDTKGDHRTPIMHQHQTPTLLPTIATGLGVRSPFGI